MNIPCNPSLRFGFLDKRVIEQMIPGTVLSSSQEDILVISTPEHHGRQNGQEAYAVRVMHPDATIETKTFRLDPSNDADSRYRLKVEPAMRTLESFQHALSAFIGPTLWRQSGSRGIGVLH